VKKDVKLKMAIKKWLDGRLVAKILKTTIQVNLVPNPTQIHLNCHYFFAISLTSCHFLAATLDFTHLFSQGGC